MQILEQFELLTELGLKVIPLYPSSKVPMYSKWNRFWNKNHCRSILKETPNANLGVLLGEILDVEGDTAEANEFLNQELKNISHPTYTSSKSTHHLFLNPNTEMTICRYKGIEFRGKYHQSVLPPSSHKDGTVYEWVDLNFPIPELPNSLKEIIKKSKKCTDLKPGHVAETCTSCKKRKYIHQKRLSLEIKVFQEFEQQWQCQACRKLDIRPFCKRLRIYGHI